MWPFSTPSGPGWGSPPTSADLKPSAQQWAGFKTGWTKGVTDKMNAWTGRSRPLTGGGATDSVGTQPRAPSPSNPLVQGAQPNPGGTFIGFSSMLPANSFNPHTAPVNSTVVNDSAQAPAQSQFDGISGFPSSRVFR